MDHTKPPSSEIPCELLGQTVGGEWNQSTDSRYGYRQRFKSPRDLMMRYRVILIGQRPLGWVVRCPLCASFVAAEARETRTGPQILPWQLRRQASVRGP